MRSVSLALFIFALLLMQVLIGGAGLVFSLPATLVLGLAGVLLVFARREEKGNAVTLWTGVSALLLAGWVVARSQFSPVVYLARWDLFLSLGALLAYLMTSCFFTRAKERLMVVGGLAGLAVVHAFIGGIQFKQGDDYMLLPGIIRSSWEWRASGFYIYPNHLAGLLEMVGMLSLALCCWGRVGMGVRVLAGWGTLMSVAGIAITGSRGGYLATVAGLLVFCTLSVWVVRRIRPDKTWPVLLLALAGVGLLLGGALFFMVKSESVSERLAQMYDPTNMRPLMWQSALRAWEQEPVVGTGSGTFVYLARQFRAPLVQGDPIFVHNDYLHLLLEYGVIGAGLGLVFLALHLVAGVGGVRKIVNVKLRPEWRTSSNELALTIGALSGLGALLLHSLVDFNFHLPGNALVGAFLLGILATPSADIRATGEKARAAGGWLPLLGPLLGLALLLLGGPLLPGEYYGELARRAVRDEHYAEGAALAERALGFERKNPNLWFHLAQARHFLTQNEGNAVARAALLEQAAEAYEEGLKLFPRDTRLLLKLGQTLDLAGRYDEAEEVYQRAIAGDPNFGNVYAYHGLHFKLQRRIGEAEECFRRARELGESEITGPALAEIERLRSTEVGKRLLAEPPAPEAAPAPPAP